MKGTRNMKIQVNTDKNIEGHEELAEQVEATVSKAVTHFSAHITRLEVHLSDENGEKNGQKDKRCMIDARLEGRQPIAVTAEAETMDQAVSGAAVKLKHSVQSTLDRLHEHH
jgi:ribosome-associated translation inhibitor RaiA